MADTKQAEFSDTGVWIDRATGKVVTKQPVAAIQLCPPGGELRPDRKAAIEAAKDAVKADTEPTATVEPVVAETVKAEPAKPRSKG